MLPAIQGYFTTDGQPPAEPPQLDARLTPIGFTGGVLAVGTGVSVMHETDLLCAALGTPRFNDPALDRLAREQGAASAWLRAWVETGAGAARSASGRFSVVVIDTRARRCWMAVDRFGVLPLCHAAAEGLFAFSDRADCVPIAGRTINPQALFDYLFFHQIPAPETLFAGIARLPAAHALRFEGGRARSEPYWQPAFEEPAGGDFQALRREFLDIVERSVAEDAAGRDVGAFLSGGTDSSTVSGMLCKVLGRPARTYSIGFDASGYDEMAYARIAARHFGTEHHEYYVTPEDLLEGIPLVATHFDQPFGNSSAVPAWICARRAREDGVERLLAGDGGDELFGGNSRYAKQRVFSWYDAVPQGLARRVIEPALALPALSRLPLLRKGASYVEQARVPLPERTEMYNLLLRLGLDKVFEPDFLAAVDAGHPSQMQRETWQSVQAGSLINRMLAFDWKYTLADNDLPKVVGATRLAEVEVAFPLLSDALVNFSLRLPPEWKLKGLTLRWFFKQALKDFLPPEIIAKKKHGFGLPFGVWAVSHEGLSRMSTRALESFGARGIVREDFLRRLVTELLPAHPGYYGEMVWIVMMLEHWLAAHHPTSAAVA